jgi:hypothetical protein
MTTDTKLRERVREWATKTSHGSAAAEVLALLDTPEAEPEPPPDAGVTREEPTLRDQFAMAALPVLAGEFRHRHGEDAAALTAYRLADAMLDACLRGEEER